MGSGSRWRLSRPRACRSAWQVSGPNPALHPTRRAGRLSGGHRSRRPPGRGAGSLGRKRGGGTLMAPRTHLAVAVAAEICGITAGFALFIALLAGADLHGALLVPLFLAAV